MFGGLLQTLDFSGSRCWHCTRWVWEASGTRRVGSYRTPSAEYRSSHTQSWCGRTHSNGTEHRAWWSSEEWESIEDCVLVHSSFSLSASRSKS